jgi:RNA polymerase sigma factor (sigma-70 family)
MQADDMDLVRQFAQSNSDEAFTTLVRRHVNLVYSVALRRLGNPHEAEEVTQAVFIILARKAASLREGIILSGWLYQTARLTSANFQRAASRRLYREQEAFMQFAENSDSDSSWQRLSPFLEEAMARLGQKERDAVVLRFFENRTVREVASALGLEEAAAQKRINRATDKLRVFFSRRGIQVSAAVLLASIGTHAVQAAPAELTTKLATTAILKGAIFSSSTLTLIKTTLKLMAWTKAKILVTGAIVIACIATTTTLVIHRQPHLPKPQPVSPTKTNFPKDSWVFAGFADPQSALVSLLWAQTKSDDKTFLSSLSPQAKQKRQQEFKDRMTKTGKTVAELFAEDSRSLDKTTGFQILGQEVVSDNEVLLHLYVQGNEMNIDAKMVKIGNEWKYDDFINQKPVAPDKRP